MKLSLRLIVSSLSIASVLVGTEAQLRGQVKQEGEAPKVVVQTNNTREAQQNELETLDELRARLPPTVWATTVADKSERSDTQQRFIDNVSTLLSEEVKEQVTKKCVNVLYKSVKSWVEKRDERRIDDYLSALADVRLTLDDEPTWKHDSVIDMGIFLGRMKNEPLLRALMEGYIRRHAYKFMEDPFGDIYQTVEHKKQQHHNTFVGVESKGEEHFSPEAEYYRIENGARFLTNLYDFYVVAGESGLYKPQKFLDDTSIFNAVLLIVETWIKQQKNGFLLDEERRDVNVTFTGMTSSQYRQYSNERCEYPFSIPANVFAASALERVVELNKRIWQSENLGKLANDLRQQIQDGIEKYGVVKSPSGMIYANEVDGRGDSLLDFDPADVPDLYSIPWFGWSGLDKSIYQETLKRASSPNQQPLSALRGKTDDGKVVQKPQESLYLTLESMKTNDSNNAQQIADQLMALLTLPAGADNAKDDDEDRNESRRWQEWSNALFIKIAETSLGIKCDSPEYLSFVEATDDASSDAENNPFKLNTANIYNTPFASNFKLPQKSFYQDLISWDSLFNIV